MLELNLLPLEDKRIIDSQRNARQIIRFGGFGLFFILVFLVLLGSIWLYLFIQQRSSEIIFQAQENSQEGRELKKFKEQIKQINQKLGHYDQLGKGIKNYSLAIEKLVELMPSGIRFKNLSLSEGEFSLEGYAETRDILVSFKEGIERSGYFGIIDSPLSNFLKQDKIDFYFVIPIK